MCDEEVPSAMLYHPSHLLGVYMVINVMINPGPELNCQ